MPGDTIGILPQNSEDDLNKIIEYGADLKANFRKKIHLQLSTEAKTMKKIPKMPIYLPTNETSLNQIFKECLDLHTFPKKSFLLALVQHNCLINIDERRYLEVLASREGSTLYTTEILQKQKTFFDLLNQLKSWNFNWKNISILLEHLPRLMPRPYSISNSLLSTQFTNEPIHPQTAFLKIIFSVKNPPGITTGMLKSLISDYKAKIPTTLSLYARQSNNFRLNDDDLNRSILMIAIGTGIAPFIGFLDHIRKMRKCSSDIKQPIWLVFGSKRKSKQVCSKYINSFLADKTLTKFNECFSKDADCNSIKYVQDVIRENAQDISEFIINQAGNDVQTKVFVCGNKKMATDVQMAIQDSFVSSGKCCDIENAKQLCIELVKNKQYIEDVWI